MGRSEPPGRSHDSEGASAAELSRRFSNFASAFPDLHLYHSIASGAARDPEVAGLLDAAPRGQVRPVLLLAALHDLVLRRNDLPVARWYPSVTGAAMPDGDPWPEVRSACLEHADDLRATIASQRTQTNEVGRAAMLAPLVAAGSADVVDLPVALVELGCSAGLLLGLDRYAVTIRDRSGDEFTLGDASSSVRLSTRSSGVSAQPVLPRIAERVGIDASPVSVDDADAVRWLEACLWPDQPERIERFVAAVELARQHPPTVVAGDMVGDLEAVAHSARAVAAAETGSADVHLVVMCSWALTYVERSRRPLIADTLAEVAADGRPVTWVSAEPPGAVPDLPLVSEPDDAPSATVLGIRRWREGSESTPEVWAHAHHHGAWFDRVQA